LCVKFAQFKRDFMGAPIRRAILNLQKGKYNFSIMFRPRKPKGFM